ncbi:helix-turn-helix domain-containing protein [Hymenobacter weizhouensis]|uniref:helix-turn-helix domain-containing protein n=1 Tax=Hymenobacter sp. YIM 151500-1 TaxID=2987689 RepID=UPI0022264B02|nr:AraC family transcriptional regulator [Hymenobacter sp. YIM 151500-1]UYZ64884.1 AraC family transcriptional regulator [Hymenobacter sp. YIM 151500-1]
MTSPATTVFYVKHMVCPRCLLVMRELLAALGLPAVRVELGEVEVGRPLDTAEQAALRAGLVAEGFELLELRAPRERLVAAVKQAVAELLCTAPRQLGSGRCSGELTRRLGRPFAYLSDAFSAVEGVGLEQYVIGQRVAAAEELLKAGTLPVGRIAQQLGYSSLGHLSRQFRRVTGVSPTEYRRARAAGVVHSSARLEAGSEPWPQIL